MIKREIRWEVERIFFELLRIKIKFLLITSEEGLYRLFFL